MTLTPIERREKCNPALIGVLAGFVSPASTIIWGIRQRSWMLAFAPYALAFTFGLITAFQSDEGKLTKGIKYSFQISSGIVAYEISKTLKEKAKKAAD